jgi:hypothetical protein
MWILSAWRGRLGLDDLDADHERRTFLAHGVGQALTAESLPKPQVVLDRDPGLVRGRPAIAPALHLGFQ